VNAPRRAARSTVVHRPAWGRADFDDMEDEMETVKVDVQKLQLLNDRIAQTIDALNQVRMSVHGIQSGQGLSSGFGPLMSQAPYGAQPWAGVPGIAPQLQGSTPFSPWLGQAFGPWLGQVPSQPFGQVPSPWLGYPGIGQSPSPVSGSPMGMSFGSSGNGHLGPITWQSSMDGDPSRGMRHAQTFPYLAYNQSPMAASF
jgi:hypothetical protein